METLEKIFGSATKAKLLRVFVYNPDAAFDSTALAKKIKSTLASTKTELRVLEKATLIKKKTVRNEKGRKVIGYHLNPNFKHLEALREFLLKVAPLTPESIARKLSNAGKAKLVVTSGIFLNKEDSRVDMLVVSDRADEKKVEKAIGEIGAEFGRDISFVILTSQDFGYRMSMGDKLIRDIFDFPHKVILNKIGLEE